MFALSRFLRAFLIVSAIIGLPTLYLAYSSSSSIEPESDLLSRTEVHWNAGGAGPAGEKDLDEARMMEWEEETAVPAEQPMPAVELDQGVVHGGVIMEKLGNATAKAELGRATWKLLHLMTLRFPDEPTKDQREALKSYFYLFSRLYPCGECAAEFQKLLEEYPPQTSSRKTASLWLCSLHNLVNVRLDKPEFDCTTLDATYDCGCGDDPAALLKDKGGEIGSPGAAGRAGPVGAGGVEPKTVLRDEEDESVADQTAREPLPFGHTPVEDMVDAYWKATGAGGFSLEEITDE